METIILKTTYRGINGKTERRHIYTTDTDIDQEERAKRDHQIVQNDLEFADDTQLFIAKDTHEQMCGRIGNYDISTETRHLAIQWGKLSCYDEKDTNWKNPPPRPLIRYNTIIQEPS